MSVDGGRKLKVAGELFADIDCDVSLALEIIHPIALFWFVLLLVAFAWAAHASRASGPDARDTADAGAQFGVLVGMQAGVQARVQAGGQAAAQAAAQAAEQAGVEPHVEAGSDWEAVCAWEWRGEKVQPWKAAVFRWVACISLACLTVVTVAWRVWELGFAKGVAQQFTYLTQWGIMLNTAYFICVCAGGCVCRPPRVAAAPAVPADAACAAVADKAFGASTSASRLGASRWLRVLVRLQVLALCIEVTVFIMWLAVALDLNLHSHLFAPAGIVLEFLLNRLPIRLRELPLLLLAMVSFLACNFAATRCWFVAYHGVITYKSGSLTWVWLGMGITVGVLTLVVATAFRRHQLARRTGAELDVSMPPSPIHSSAAKRAPREME